jgi:hypothetical protein
MQLGKPLWDMIALHKIDNNQGYNAMHEAVKDGVGKQVSS